MSSSMAIGRPAKPAVDPPVAAAIRWRGGWGRRTLRKYAGKWVALRGKRVVAAERTYERLGRSLERLGKPAVYVCRIEAPGLVVY